MSPETIVDALKIRPFHSDDASEYHAFITHPLVAQDAQGHLATEFQEILDLATAQSVN